MPLQASANTEVLDVIRNPPFLNIQTHSTNKRLGSQITCSIYVNGKLVHGGQMFSTGAFNELRLMDNSKTKGKPIKVSCK